MINLLTSNFETKKGSWSNIDESIDAFDLPKYDNDELYLFGKKIAEINYNTFRVEFKGSGKADFEKEVFSSGLFTFLQNHLKKDDIDINIAAIVACEKNTTRIDEYYKNSKAIDKLNNKSYFDKFISVISGDTLLKTDGIAPLERHRVKLKKDNISKQGTTIKNR